MSDNSPSPLPPDPVGEGGKHTPGPWRADGCEIIGDSRVVATVHWCSGMAIEDQANIRLIAAAPTMLAACEFALIIAKEYDETGFAGTIVLKQKLIAAIAKAKGQTS